MRHWILSIVAIAALGVPARALAQVPAPGDPGAGIAETAHDFTDDAQLEGNSVGLCTFCHTPHRAFQTRLLWNHTLSAEVYGWSDAIATTGGTPFPSFDATWQGVSKNCLSCHDGTVAIGDVAWFGAQANRNLRNHAHDEPTDPVKITGHIPDATGAVDDGDLAGNHPVAHPFPLNGAPSTYNGVTTGPAAAASGWRADPESLGIRLFNDNGGDVTAGSVAGSTGIECSSCHDPHNGPQVLSEFFLRGTIDGNDTNYICLKCHDK